MLWIRKIDVYWFQTALIFGWFSIALLPAEQTAKFQIKEVRSYWRQISRLEPMQDVTIRRFIQYWSTP